MSFSAWEREMIKKWVQKISVEWPWDGSGWPGGCGGWSDPVSNNGGGVKERSWQWLNKKGFANFLRHFQAVLFNSCSLMFLCVYSCWPLNLSGILKLVLTFCFCYFTSGVDLNSKTWKKWGGRVLHNLFGRCCFPWRTRCVFKESHS